ncbi:DUF47 family protein [Oceanotoga sp. DSM 15011]|jgi:hypothetical protein|uniref:Phosphate transport regulator n=1 Tax=Oceanotoga teriensis TaxID=515440 RepID=A0AA45C932_9BACT|nr:MULTISPECIES: DUF47 family protein [Oceanotoga]MDN5341584.1 uncharacterized protein [Oceanotoga sp.]MDO7977212.1 DUF47 family protein [Oceanotoga teriensis]PWJ96516.1 hypothetical protein C7380_10188 [Oceanotoga teriensis]UYP00309.1 DUF47 family protein [Oceanotoga sp. DSM 15011]
MSLWGKVFQKFNPITEIINHARIIENASDYLPELFRKYLEHEDITNIVNVIDSLEDEADEIKRNIRQNLKRGYMYRFERVDLLDYIEIQDKIADSFEDIGRLMLLNEVEITPEAKAKIFSIVEEVEKMIDLFKKSVKFLEEVIDSDFSKEKLEAHFKDITEIKWYEKDIDSKIFEFGKWLFSQKNDMNPVDIFFLRQIILILSEIADTCQNVSDRIFILING